MKNLDNLEKSKVSLIVAIVVVVLATIFVLVFINIGKMKSKEVVKDVEKSLKDNKEKIVFVQSSNKKDCPKCNEVKSYLDSKKIKYIVYDKENYTKNEYEKFLKTLKIKPSDFGYPAVIYVRDGIMYANVINITDTKYVDQFIKDYKLDKVK